jgi:hypothetical protein
MQMVGVYINRMLDGVAVGRTFSKRYCIGITYHHSVLLGDQMWQPALEHILAPALDIIAMQWLDIKLAEATLDVMGIDR